MQIIRDQRDNLVLAALLHDIGKLVQRANDQPQKMTHQEFGALWLRERGIAEIIPSLVERHHLIKKTDPKFANLDARISHSTLTICQADWLAAGERPEKETSTKGEGRWKSEIPLLSIFSRIHLSSEKDILRYSDPSYICEKIPYPQKDVIISKDKYKECLKNFENDFLIIKDALTVNNLIVLLEKHTSFIPSETRVVEGKIESYPDVSLFDHLKLTAAIAAAIDIYLFDNYPERYKRNELLSAEIQNMEDEKFLLIGGDLSGVQKFIYTISSKGALKTLRARSFFLEILTEHVITEFLKKVGLTRANIVYSGGGRFYILAPNTPSIKRDLQILAKKINEWLFEKFRGRLYLVTGTRSFSSKDLQSDNISNIWSDLGIELAKSKSEKFKEQLKEILKIREPKILFDNCSICHRDDIEDIELKPLHEEDPENKACLFCRSLYNLGDELIDMRFLGVTRDETLAKKTYNYPIEIKSIEDGIFWYVPLKKVSNYFDMVYVINNWDLGEYKPSNTVPLLVGNYVRKVGELPRHARESGLLNSTATFSELAKSSRGANRIGILRVDVDNLGRVFTQGFKKEMRSFSRLASLSRQLNLFFKYYINSVCKGELGANLECLDLSEKFPKNNLGRNVSIVYSGGDDLFLIGAWDEVTEIAFDLQKSFELYTCQNPDLTVSGGLVVQREDFPLYLLADLAGKAEELAKRSRRNRITLFYNPAIEEKKKGTINPVKQVFLWKDADKEVVDLVKIFRSLGKMDKDNNCFKPGFPHSFLYKLFSIFEEWERRGVMYLPKMVYIYRRLREYLSKNREMPELGHLEKVLMNKEKIKNLRTCLTWIELLTRTGDKNI